MTQQDDQFNLPDIDSFLNTDIETSLDIGPGITAPEAKPESTCPDCWKHLSQISDLKAELELKSRHFSETIEQLKQSYEAKAKAAQIDEQLIEQCVREKTHAQANLEKLKRAFEQQINNLKSQQKLRAKQAQQQINQRMEILKQQQQSAQQKIAEVTENARHDAQRYEQIISRIKEQVEQQITKANSKANEKIAALENKIRQMHRQNTQLNDDHQKELTQAKNEIASRQSMYEQNTALLKSQYEDKMNEINLQAGKRLQAQAQEIARLRAELEHTNEKIDESKKAKLRAETLNRRLVEQCQMAKTGADVEIEQKTKAITESFNKLKGEAASRLRAYADQTNQTKTQAQTNKQAYAEALRKANARIKALEDTLANLHLVQDIKSNAGTV